MFRYVAGAGFAALLLFEASHVAASEYVHSDGVNVGAYLRFDAEGYRDSLRDPYAGHIRLHRSLGAKSYTSPYALPDQSPLDEPTETTPANPSPQAR